MKSMIEKKSNLLTEMTFTRAVVVHGFAVLAFAEIEYTLRLRNSCFVLFCQD